MFQKIIMVGRTGKDAIQKYTPKGEAVTSFSLAVDDGYGEKKKTIWPNVSVWGKLSETLKDMKKGTLILIEGRLIADETGNPRIYKRTDGSSGTSFEISASTVRFLSAKQGENDTPTVKELLDAGWEIMSEEDIF